jgi:NAD(P)-dependent dehydrogenase (short-subunit alcohol dehydrogenase family)
MSQGQLPQSVIDDLVVQANGGVMPTEEPDTGWKEQLTAVRFTGKTVIVTGAASGIGRATASSIAREGGRVIAVDVTGERLTSFRDSLPEAEIVTVTGDITQQSDIDAIVTAAGDRIGALANVAGINDDFSPLHETTDALGPGHRDQPHRRFQAHPRGPANHAAARQGVDRQRFV